MTSPVGIVWALLSIVVAGACSLSLLQPYWFIHPETRNSFGMYSYCLHRTQSQSSKSALTSSPLSSCGIYGGYFDFSNFPSSSFQAACVMFGGGCLFLCLSAMLSITVLCVPQRHEQNLALFAGYLQCIAVIVMVMGLLVYPMGLDATLVQYYCPKAGIYNSGDCHVGWGYMLAICGVALSFFCPYLSRFTNYKLSSNSEPDPVFV